MEKREVLEGEGRRLPGRYRKPDDSAKTRVSRVLRPRVVLHDHGGQKKISRISPITTVGRYTTVEATQVASDEVWAAR